MPLNFRFSTPAVVLLALTLRLPAQQVTIIEHHLPIMSSRPTGITSGSDGALWFTEQAANQIGRFTTGGALTEYLIPAPNNGPELITAGPDGALWFTEDSGSVGRITTGGVITQFPVIPGQDGLYGITTGPDNALWITYSDVFNINLIYRMTTTGSLTSYSLPYLSTPSGIVSGPDGALWFTEVNTSSIGRITTSGEITQFPLAIGSAPGGITLGPDGALWFTENGTQKIGRITTDGTVSEYASAKQSIDPIAITSGPDGALWFTSFYPQEELGRITTDGAITLHLDTLSPNLSLAIVTGSDGALWFTEFAQGNIAQAVFPTAELSANPQNPEPGDTITYSGTGFGGGEVVNAYYNSTGTNPVFTVNAAADGSFHASSLQGECSFSRRIIAAVGQTSGKLGVAVLEFQPHIKNISSCPQPGCSDDILGYGFCSGEPVTLYLGGGTDEIGTTTANADGGFSFEFTLPKVNRPGEIVVVGIGSITHAVGRGLLDIQ